MSTGVNTEHFLKGRLICIPHAPGVYAACHGLHYPMESPLPRLTARAGVLAGAPIKPLASVVKETTARYRLAKASGVKLSEPVWLSESRALSAEKLQSAPDSRVDPTRLDLKSPELRRDRLALIPAA